jgi:glutaminase
MLARIQKVAKLVQRYLDQIRDEHASVTDRTLAIYIPELAGVEPTGFGLSLSLSDGYVYESGDATVEFTIQSISKPITYALALDQIGQDAIDARNAGTIAAVSLVPGATPDASSTSIPAYTPRRTRPAAATVPSRTCCRASVCSMVTPTTCWTATSGSARVATTLARGGVSPATGQRVTDTVVVQRTLSVIVICGMSDAAGDWVSAVGMPAKNGSAAR